MRESIREQKSDPGHSRISQGRSGSSAHPSTMAPIQSHLARLPEAPPPGFHIPVWGHCGSNSTGICTGRMGTKR